MTAAPTPTVEDIRDRLAVIRGRIATAGGSPESVTVLAVTKTFDAEVAQRAVDAGLGHLGENYAAEVMAKAPQVTGATWHFIGGLQRNKVRRIAGIIDLWQSVDRIAVADEIARHAPGARVLIQVNTTDEPQKSGCAPSLLDALLAHCDTAGLEVAGLMTIGPGPGLDPRPAFATLRAAVDRHRLAICSMGMSADLEAAVAEGSTMVRVGTALFGPRVATDRTGPAVADPQIRPDGPVSAQ